MDDIDRRQQKEIEDRRKLQSRLIRVSHKVVVMSGKGGVGKSTVAVNLAVALAMSGKRVGLLDVDMHGPSVPTMLGLERETVHASGEELVPVHVQGVKVLSLGFFLQSQDDAVIWRGPLKMNVIKQFLTDVAWGDLDYLIIDCPPGTGDEPLSVCQLIDSLDGAVIVTTPQKVAAVDVRKAITFCRQVQVPVLGVVENMSGFVCPLCGEMTRIFRSGGGEEIAEDMGVPFLGAVPIDPEIVEACDGGFAFVSRHPDSPAARVMREIVQSIAAREESTRPKVPEKSDISEKSKEIREPLSQKEEGLVRIALPLSNGEMAMHFGHCEKFALLDVDPATKKIVKRDDIEAPPHQPGLLPAWLAERGVTIVISGGMGHRARDLFAERGIEVVVGASTGTPERLVGDYLAGTLATGENICDH
jgi:ATP-binding protein involved in chromosome partitioning